MNTFRRINGLCGTVIAGGQSLHIMSTYQASGSNEHVTSEVQVRFDKIPTIFMLFKSFAHLTKHLCVTEQLHLSGHLHFLYSGCVDVYVVWACHPTVLMCGVKCVLHFSLL